MAGDSSPREGILPGRISLLQCVHPAIFHDELEHHVGEVRGAGFEPLLKVQLEWGRSGTRLRHSPEFATAAHATLEQAQGLGYVAERTEGSGRHTTAMTLTGGKDKSG